MVNQSGAFAGAGVTPTAMGNAHPSIAPYEVYETKEKKIVIAVGNDGQFMKFCSAIGADFASDPRFATNPDRVKNRIELNALLTPLLSQKDAAQWSEELAKVGVPAGTINTVADGVNFGEQLGLSPIVTITDPRDGTVSRTIANPITFSATPVEYHLGPPALGVDD
jgi:crotonobetainyl-CoA:carnitine CoA-transferase CaiB-like acyl-CoA transferase